MFIIVRFAVDELNKAINATQRDITAKMKSKEPADDLLAKKNDLTKERDVKKTEMDQKEVERDQKLVLIGNLVHDSVPVSSNEV
jgi:seryl-tRNA synthetase